ncbi:MAG: sulfotransferase domain-containing protein [Pseudomonadota bacterium]
MTVQRKRDQTRDPRTDGRLIISYPKSGRTWLRYALSERNIDVDFTHAGLATHRTQMGSRFEKIPDTLKNIPLVFLYRNPIDTVVSLYHQIHNRDFRAWSGRWMRMYPRLALQRNLPPQALDEFVLHPIYGVENICRYNRAWIDHTSSRSDCLVLNYEAMRANAGDGFQALLDFWNDQTTTGADLAETSRFEKMKQAEVTGAHGGVLQAKALSDPNSSKVRKGKVKGYTDDLKPETIRAARDVAARHGFEQV